MRISILLLMLLPNISFAEESITPKEIAEEFLSTIQSGEIDKAYNQLFAGSSIPSSKPQAVTMIKNQTQSGLPIYGKILSYDFVKEVKYGKSIVRLVYILKSEKAPTVWEFHFYKPQESWFLANILFNDQFSLLK